MVFIHICKCGRKWKLATSDSGGRYVGFMQCSCNRLIALWQGPFFHLSKERPQKAKAAGSGAKQSPRENPMHPRLRQRHSDKVSA